MIQELLGSGQGEANNKVGIAGGLSSTSSLSSAPSSPAAAPFSSGASSDQQNLKCPRCDSTNTKFCYYNNYNLTQPRHFCKTCRRYWTKGGALRNVPIGGGCRKAKNNGGGAAICRSTKAKTLIKSSLDSLSVGPHGFEQELPPNQILWPTPSNSHLFSLLRSTVVPSNPNPNPNSARTKDEGNLNVSHLVPDASLLRNALNARNVGFDYLSQASLGLSTPWINNQHQEGGFLLGETASTGIQELYQRMRSNGQYFSDRHGKSMGELGSQSSSTIFSFSPSGTVSAASTAASGHGVQELGGGEFGYWSSPYAWADMPAMNGSFP